MKQVTLLAVALLVAAMAGPAVRAGEMPWKAPAAGDAAGGPVDLKAELPPAHYDRVVKPIESRAALAEKALESLQKEMEKPEEKRSEAFILRCKETAAGHYLSAAGAAKRAQAFVKEDRHKAALRDQYEVPNRQKGTDLLLELATDAQARNDLRRAVGYYRQVLAADPENASAKDALAKLAEQYKQAQRDAQRGANKGGSSDDDDRHSWDRPDYGWSSPDWSKWGRPGW